MAALKARQASPNRIVLTVPFAQRISSLFSLVIILFAVLSFLGPLLDSGQGGNPLTAILENPVSAIIFVIVAFFFLRTLSSVLISPRVVVDASSRTVTRSMALLGIPLNQTSLAFDRVRRVLVSASSPVLLNQSGARSIWHVALELTEGQPLVVNSNGGHNEMATLAAQLSSLMNRPVADEMKEAAAQPVEQIFRPLEDFEGGTGTGGMPPVVLPGPFTRMPSSTLPETTPVPASTFTDTGTSASTTYSSEAAAPTSTPQAGTSYTEYTPASPPRPMMQGPMSAPLSGSSMPPLGPALDTGMMSGIDTAIQAPAPEPSAAQPPPTAYGPIMGTGSTDLYSAPLGDIKAPETPIPDVPSAASFGAAQSQPDEGRRLTIDDLKERIRADPTDALSYYRLGRVFHARRSYGDAFNAYQSAVHFDPTRADAWNDLGVLYYMRGQPKEAETAFRRAAGLDPFSGAAHYNLGLLLTRTGRRVEGASEFRRAANDAANNNEQNLFDNALNGNLGDPVLSSPP